MKKREHIVSEGQSLVDVALQRHGRAEDVFLLLEENPTLSLASSLIPGSRLVYSDVERNVAKLYQQRNYVPNCNESGGLCSIVTGAYFRTNFSAGWNGVRYVVSSMELEPTTLVQSIAPAQGSQALVKLNGLTVGYGSFSTASSTYNNWVSLDVSHGTVGINGGFGFLDGKDYQIEIEIDSLTLVDGSVCLDKFITKAVSFPSMAGMYPPPSFLNIIVTSPSTASVAWGAILGSSYHIRCYEIGQPPWLDIASFGSTVAVLAGLKKFPSIYIFEVAVNYPGGYKSVFISKQFQTSQSQSLPAGIPMSL